MARARGHHGRFEAAAPFAAHEWCRTHIRHKRKAGQPVRYAIPAEVVLASGERKAVVKGTQAIDGYWATLRRCVGKVPVNTGHSSSAEVRGWLRALVRVHQWRWWHLGEVRFRVLGRLYSERRAGLSF